MIGVRRLTANGIDLFEAWLQNPIGSFPPSSLLSDEEYAEVFDEALIDPGMKFSTRYEFGEYLSRVFSGYEFKGMLGPENDGLWAWLAVLYFAQLSEKEIRRSEHYLVQRTGMKGSLAYRQAPRSCYELVSIHGENALVCLSVPMHTYGDMTEQLASRQTLAHNKGFFNVAASLYLRGGKLRRGASSRAKSLKNRKQGDRTGFGGGGRLATALRRLDLTFDTEIMDATNLISVLPKEFRRWGNSSID